MKRQIARWQTQWLWIFFLGLIAGLFVDWPAPTSVPLMLMPLALAFVRPPRSTRDAVELAPPVRGRWVAVNSPGSAVPSHGVRAYGQAYAVDLLQPSFLARRSRVGWSFVTRDAEQYPSFRQPVLAMASGTVVQAMGSQRDHRGRDTWPALIFMLVVEGPLRELAGARRILGNHVVVQHDDGTCSLYAHLRRGSLKVEPGERVSAGQQLADIGNSGNSSEPHLHVQVMDDPRPTAAAGVPFWWPDVAVSGEVDEARVSRKASSSAVPGVPQNGQVFLATDR